MFEITKRPKIEEMNQGLEFILKNQKYLRFFRSHEPTSTCYEKSDLLQKVFPEEKWTDKRIIKAIYTIVGWDPYLFVFPELRRREIGMLKGEIPKKLKKKWGNKGFLDENVVKNCFQYANISISDYEPFVGEEAIPPSMEPGTCSPFIGVNEIIEGYGKIKGIFVHKEYDLNPKNIIDVSIGGKSLEAHHWSLQLPYSTIYSTLKEQFHKITYELNFWEHK